MALITQDLEDYNSVVDNLLLTNKVLLRHLDVGQHSIDVLKDENFKLKAVCERLALERDGIIQDHCCLGRGGSCCIY